MQSSLKQQGNSSSSKELNDRIETAAVNSQINCRYGHDYERWFSTYITN